MSSVPADVSLPAPESVLSEHSIEEIDEWLTRYPG